MLLGAERKGKEGGEEEEAAHGMEVSQAEEGKGKSGTQRARSAREERRERPQGLPGVWSTLGRPGYWGLAMGWGLGLSGISWVSMLSGSCCWVRP